MLVPCRIAAAGNNILVLEDMAKAARGFREETGRARARNDINSIHLSLV